ncbi:MAG TPA: bifunctional methylenetetrahydrofolate dehydrogenase/methenyltetrahydrofolate cyclohydrolase FolD [Candidatus Hydrogenedentes bacterium]|nr:bifunctional methylenetetrahydrofolate dehydrogenase/methenyltetrahydrofolate cyclohydrolase FolD [Candidatus Hydrogenedentota bacterium]HRT19506.1 bifunctional methylenetetrahydrofolate dehydrogenase/methenyltetrahydrofolate cyclohydrolase FolD [Candidatus Hydrogenedentota bacterium]HRT64238.1 bifunctional methylenetetrahydrofolate dehydrogenase/methenyltetrahydrofolate cyclohydrolase FolD [Candidatus Hydrogenedentota bacterium]
MAKRAYIIDGGAIAAELRAEMKAEVAALAKRRIVPGLAVVLVGENPASQVYVRMKKKACAEVGIQSFSHELPAECSEKRLLNLITKLNADPRVHGILVQLPLPKQIAEAKVIAAMDPEKDVDGFHPVNVGRMLSGDPGFLPCTPAGCQALLVRSGFDPSGKHVVIVGRSNIVGKPLAAILMQKAAGANATVTVCHSRTRDLPAITRMADILVAAIGVPEFVKADMIRRGAVVIDVGVNRVDDSSAPKGYRLVGDVDFPAVSKKAAAITPVPGGVGPMTIAMLLKNTVESARRHRTRA